MNDQQSAYQFGKQFHNGQQGELFLDQFFAHWFHIRAATDDQQRQGIDRHFKHLVTQEQYTVEYKTDNTAARTDNAFIETISVSTEEKAGWAFTSQADILLYYVPDKQVIYIVKMAAIRGRLPFWLETYQTRDVPNRDYITRGLLVPLAELERIAERILFCGE